MKNVKFSVVVLLLVLPIIAFSQTITTSPLVRNELCYQDTFEVSYTITGQFEPDNVFIVQTSNNNFSTFKNIGNLKNVNSGTIQAALPKDINTAINYRIRVISSNPYIAGSDNGSDIIVYPSSQQIIIIHNNYYNHFYGVEDSIEYRLYPSDYEFPDGLWNFGEGAEPSTYIGHQPPSVIYHKAGEKIITFEMVSIPYCYKDSTKTNTKVTILDCEVSIDSTAIIDSTEMSEENYIFNDYQQIWILPTGNVTIQEATKAIFILEAGASLKLLKHSQNCLYYLKPGASLSFSINDSCCNAIVTAPGASVTGASYNNEGVYNFINCPSITYNYSKASRKGIEIMQRLGYLSVEEENENEISLVPNPASDFVEINLERCPTLSICRTSEIRIYNTLGECVMTTLRQVQGTNDVRFDVTHLPAGVYYIKIGTQTKMFVKM